MSNTPLSYGRVHINLQKEIEGEKTSDVKNLLFALITKFITVLFVVLFNIKKHYKIRIMKHDLQKQYSSIYKSLCMIILK